MPLACDRLEVRVDPEPNGQRWMGEEVTDACAPFSSAPARFLWRAMMGTARRLNKELPLGLHVRRAVGLGAAFSLSAKTVERVVCPSLTALELFAQHPHAERILLLDKPMLALLHRDLDEAATHWPDGAWLRNYRARRALVARQLQECVLATRVLVRSRYVARWLATRGVSAERWAPPRLKGPALQRGSRDVLLGGMPTSRNGIEVALAALPSGHRLWARRRGPHVSTAPQISFYEGQPPPVALVVAPAWVESAPPELDWARAAGIPTVATRQAAGWGAVDVELRAGDVDALRRAMYM